MDDATRTAALERLDPLVGEWTAELHFSFTPEPTTGRLSFAWELDGQFLLQRSGVEHPDAPGTLSVIAVADEGDGHDYVQHYFDSRGVARLYDMTYDGETWTVERTKPDFTPLEFCQRYVGHFADDRRSITGEWLSSPDGVEWTKDFGLTYRRR